jgi:hypothetical protein
VGDVLKENQEAEQKETIITVSVDNMKSEAKHAC